jgi:hypothetical protein
MVRISSAGGSREAFAYNYSKIVNKQELGTGKD